MNRLILTVCFFILSAGVCAQEVRDTVMITDDWRYEGQWPEGDGVRYSEKYGIYIGRFVEGEPVGACLCVSIDRSEIYYGSIKNGIRNGFGILSRPGHFYYQGNFENGYYEGLGRLFYPDMSVYVGCFHVGKPTYEGAQIYEFSNKSQYAAKLPVLPKYKLTNKQKAFLNKVLRNQLVQKDETKDAGEYIKPKFLDKESDLFPKWVSSLLVYPPEAISARQEGVVKIKFTILKTGELGDPFVLESSGVPAFDVEVFRVVCTSPDWIPGTLDGEARSVTYTFPIMFGFR